MSYTIDIYRSKIKPERKIINFAVFVSMFPQLVAGPIERASNLLPQIAVKRKFDFKQFKIGILQIFVGLTKKMLIADTISIYVDTIYSNHSMHNSITLIVATYLYAIQIYCDFAGYSDIAIGTARLFNFTFIRNFDRPYISKTLSEFWRRWHISLSSWLRDYLYISMGGNRGGQIITYRNLFLTMLLGGLWHGAAWNFIIWGIFHGIVLSVERAARVVAAQKGSLLSILQSIITFNLVCLSWIFFRSINIEQAASILSTIVNMNFSDGIYTGNINTIAHIILAIFVFWIFQHTFDGPDDYKKLVEKQSNFTVYFIITTLILGLVLFYQGNQNAFIYFQF